jgi:hypothetical protein
MVRYVRETGTRSSFIRRSIRVPVDLTTTYLKIEKIGDIYTGYYSADGVSWTKVQGTEEETKTQMDSFDTSLQNIQIGLYACSGLYEAGGSYGQINADFDYFECISDNGTSSASSEGVTPMVILVEDELGSDLTPSISYFELESTNVVSNQVTSSEWAGIESGIQSGFTGETGTDFAIATGNFATNSFSVVAPLPVNVALGTYGTAKALSEGDIGTATANMVCMIPSGAVTATCWTLSAAELLMSLPTCEITESDIIYMYQQSNYGQATVMTLADASSYISTQTSYSPSGYNPGTGGSSIADYYATSENVPYQPTGYQQGGMCIVRSPAWLRVVDKEGNISGYDTSRSQYEMGIPGSKYIIDKSGHDNIFLPEAPEQYSFHLLGNGEGDVDLCIMKMLLWQVENQEGNESSKLESIPMEIKDVPMHEGDRYSFAVNFDIAAKELTQDERVGLTFSQAIKVMNTGNFPIDVKSPKITITGIDNKGRYDGQVTVNIMAQDDCGQVDLTSLLDGSPYISGTAITAPGLHILSAQAIDPSGNTTRKNYSFFIEDVGTEAANQSDNAIVPIIIGVLGGVVVLGAGFLVLRKFKTR